MDDVSNCPNDLIDMDPSKNLDNHAMYNVKKGDELFILKLSTLARYLHMNTVLLLTGVYKI